MQCHTGSPSLDVDGVQTSVPADEAELAGLLKKADLLDERNELVAEGLSNKAIAQSLSVSENTVKYHVRNILQKLSAQNRTEAVAHAIRAGLFKATE